jgi:sugar phosphate isomerase/epimerase
VWTVADDYTDAEIEAGFRQLRALGVKMFTTNQTRVTMGPKIAPFAEKYRIQTAWHPHSNVKDPREVATPEGMEKLLDMSKAFVINLDIGHYTAGNNDAVAFLRKHHKRITHLHIKDRKRDNGPNVQLGTGDTPIDACLRLIRDNRWPIYAIIEREYRDAPGSPVEQTRWQMDYLRKVLSA